MPTTLDAPDTLTFEQMQQAIAPPAFAPFALTFEEMQAAMQDASPPIIQPPQPQAPAVKAKPAGYVDPDGFHVPPPEGWEPGMPYTHDPELKARVRDWQFEKDKWEIAMEAGGPSANTRMFDEHLPPAARLAAAVENYSANDEDWTRYLIRKVPFAGGAWDVAELSDVYSASKRLQRNEGAPEDYMSVGRFLAQSKRDEAQSWPAYLRDTILSIPGFATEFALTSGAYTVARKGAKKAALPVLKKAVKQGLTRKIIRKGAVGVGAAAVGTAAQMAVSPQLWGPSITRRMASEAIGNLTPDDQGRFSSVLDDEDETFLAALLRHTPAGFADAFIEIGSERTGLILTKALAKIPVPTKLKALKAAVIKRWLSKNPKGGMAALVRKLKSKAAWDGILGESFEERVGEVARGATGVEETYGATGELVAGDRLKGLGQVATEILAFSVYGIGMGVLQFASLNPEVAERLSNIDSPSRKDFQDAGLPIGTAKKRRKFREDLKKAMEIVAELQRQEAANEQTYDSKFGALKDLPIPGSEQSPAEPQTPEQEAERQKFLDQFPGGTISATDQEIADRTYDRNFGKPPAKPPTQEKEDATQRKQAVSEQAGPQAPEVEPVQETIAEQAAVEEVVGPEKGFKKRGVLQTKSPEFKAWFGDSVVVDKSEKPMIVFHGTANDFDKFKLSEVETVSPFDKVSKHAIFFTDAMDLASDYADAAAEFGVGKQRIIPVYLSMKSPFRLSESDWESLEARPEDEIEAVFQELKQNHDGLIIDGPLGVEYAVFDPSQIKVVPEAVTKVPKKGLKQKPKPPGDVKAQQEADFARERPGGARRPDVSRAEGDAMPTDAGRPDVETPDTEADDISRRTFRPIPMPELFQLAKELMGKAPQIKKMQGVLGAFRSQEGSRLVEILINPKTAKDEAEIVAVLAHEIGHLVDFLPDKTMLRGNILGRIASLRNFLKGWLEGKPGGPKPLTKAERAELQKLAREASQWTDEEMVDEEIRKVLSPITPADIINIWNSTEKPSNEKLMQYIKRLSSAEKKSLVIAAMKGLVPEEVQALAESEVVGTQRVKKSVRRKGSKGDVRRKFEELLKAEIERRELLGRKLIHHELIALSEWWTPYDKSEATSRYIQYRESSKELYAEALSVLLVAPGELEQRAPNFYRGFLAYAARKPEVADAYLTLQDILAGTPEEIAEGRRKNIHEMFARGDDKIVAARMAREAAQQSAGESIRQFLEQYILDSGAPVKSRSLKQEKAAKDRGEEIPDAKNVRYILDELNTSENVNHIMLDRINEVYQPMIQGGLTRADIGEYMLMRRIVNERNEIANPLAFRPTEAAEQIVAMRKRLGNERFGLLEVSMVRYHDIVFEIAESAVEHGVYSRAKFEADIKPNKGNYAAFAVIKYLEDHIGAGLYKQVGTFEEVANPFDATIMKMITLNRLIEINKTKNSIINDLLLVDFPEDAIKTPIPRGDITPRKRPRAGKNYLVHLVDGEHVAYEVPKNIAMTMKNHDVGGIITIANVIQSATYKYLHPAFVTYNPGFLAANPVRDFLRTYANLVAIGAEEGKIAQRALRARGGATRKELQAAAREKRITLGDVVEAYWNALPASVRRAKEIRDPLILQMFGERALGTPFVELDIESQTKGEFESLLKRHGLQDANLTRSKAMKVLFSLLGTLEAVGVVQETASKVAAWELLTERGIVGKKRAYIIRKYVGTPDWKQKGLATPVTNTAWLYSRVKWNGIQADAELATKTDTRAAWWWRHLIIDVIPTISIKLAGLGVFGVALKAMFDRIPQYFLDTYTVIPFWLFGSDDDEEEKVGFLTITKDDSGRIISKITSKAMDLALEAGGVDTPSQTPGKAASGIADAVKDSVIPSLNPFLDIASKWGQFATDRNPHDDYRGLPVIPDNEWDAGGWYATRKMLSWTVNKFGVVSTILHPVTGPLLGEPFSDQDETTLETTVRSIPGFNRYVRISDRGLSEQHWAKLENEDRERKKFNLTLPRSVRSATAKRYLYGRRGTDRLSEKEKVSKWYLDQWYTGSYLPLTKAIREAVDNDDKVRENKFRENLERDTESMWSNIR